MLSIYARDEESVQCRSIPLYYISGSSEICEIVEWHANAVRKPFRINICTCEKC